MVESRHPMHRKSAVHTRYRGYVRERPWLDQRHFARLMIFVTYDIQSVDGRIFGSRCPIGEIRGSSPPSQGEDL